MNEPILEGMLAEVDSLRAQLASDRLDAEQATEILERVTALAQQALAEIERRAEALEAREQAT